jgi:hypothetical protein
MMRTGLKSSAQESFVVQPVHDRHDRRVCKLATRPYRILDLTNSDRRMVPNRLHDVQFQRGEHSLGPEKFDHFVRTFFTWSVRRDRTDSEGYLTPRHSNADSIAGVNFAARFGFLPVHRHSTGIAHVFGKRATQDHAAPL